MFLWVDPSCVGLRAPPPPCFRTQGHAQLGFRLAGWRWAQSKSRSLAFREACDPTDRGGRQAVGAKARGRHPPPGGCRRTFAPKACRPRRARQIAPKRAIEQFSLSREKNQTKTPRDAGRFAFLRYRGAENSAPGDRQIGRAHV